MFYLLLLVLGVSAAYADDCKGLTPDADFPNVCEPDEFRTDKERGKRIGTKACPGCSTTRSSTPCKRNCDTYRKVGKTYTYLDYAYEKKPCNNNTGLVPQSDTSKFLCKNKDTGFLCKNDDYDDEVFYCGCKKAVGGTFGTTCYYTTDAENTVVSLAFLLALVAFLHFAYIRYKKPEKDDFRDNALIVFLGVSSFILVVGNLIRLTTEKENGIFAAGMVVALVVLGAESYYIRRKFEGEKEEEKEKEEEEKLKIAYATVAEYAKPYRDNRFNII